MIPAILAGRKNNPNSMIVNTKKEIRQKVVAVLQKTLSDLSITTPPKKVDKLIERFTRKFAVIVKDAMKRDTSAVTKKAKKGNSKNEKAKASKSSNSKVKVG